MTNHARSGAYYRNHHTKGRHTMDWKLEVVPIPVSDVDRAKRFSATLGQEPEVEVTLV